MTLRLNIYEDTYELRQGYIQAADTTNQPEQFSVGLLTVPVKREQDHVQQKDTQRSLAQTRRLKQHPKKYQKPFRNQQHRTPRPTCRTAPTPSTTTSAPTPPATPSTPTRLPPALPPTNSETSSSAQPTTQTPCSRPPPSATREASTTLGRRRHRQGSRQPGARDRCGRTRWILLRCRGIRPGCRRWISGGGQVMAGRLWWRRWRLMTRMRRTTG